ncbi:MAG: hypothetical protein CL858_24260 [Cupriavidus sp.]|uniref:hypothetical protein n=1 Tax=Cupriavidus pauculus TaxID=82633 RepID=UPI000C5CCA35|nr:hypothetical protein [Cupriavidus sp.]
MPTLIAVLAALPALVAPFVALGLAAYAHHRWLQRFEKGMSKMGIVSTPTMIDRLVGLIDTQELRIEEVIFVRALKEKVRRSRIVDLTADEVEKLDEIHGRLFR